MTRRAEWAVAITATAILVALHLVFLFAAGALWRDEVNSVNVANLSWPREVWAHLRHDSFPLLWFGVLRAWMQIVPGTTDFGIRILGLLIGLGILGALWRNARAFGSSVPLLSLTLLGFNSVVICYGDSIRGYGLGALTGLLTFGLVWEVADAPTPKRVALAMLTALVGVHCLYYNAVFVLAACVAGAVVTLRRRSWRSAVMIVGIGAVCAISLLPYWLTVRNVLRGEGAIQRVDMDRTWIWHKVVEAFASTGGAIHWAWIGLAALAAAAALHGGLRRAGRGVSERERDAALYCGVAMLVGLPVYLLFLKTLRYVTQPWYYLALMALVAACLDAPLSLVARTPAGRRARLVLIVAVTALVIHPVWTAVRTRMTNVDRVASKLGGLAVSGDLIVVSPWYIGITFDRYYHGRADWVTVPPMASHAMHRYDLLKVKMMTPGAIAPVLDQIGEALRTGHRVFWVGDFFLPRPGEVPAEPPAAPGARWGWADSPYYRRWGLLAGFLIQSHAEAAERIEVPLQQKVSLYENAGLQVFSGWRRDAGAQ